ncbi:Glycosyl hydrolase family 20, catalytic domain [Catalinimonas alkaloidigena]|uniref:beta-N-acetylhexosaminidase n=1 Tax=Catalinimonas alkaloidigena TaxID=1075417 RepID=A0A1G9SDS7_9BACT|nr:family 20 glycosylhydrolase [Catalinimonas alkaloidigena]SDM33646.1 Glycosyl hydrolase family 20, catalytic domain [Catalinimonas alkaloidigena]
MNPRFSRSLLLLFWILLWARPSLAQLPLDSLLLVRGFCIGSPQADGVADFVKFIDNELAPRQVNTLILRIDYNYQYESHPELRDEGALSKADVKKMVEACKRHGIRLIPQINLLGHQSWASKVTNLLRVYPQFDETPAVQMPAHYEWPNEDGLYCKSYCPLHPDVHDVVFALVDEITEAFETDAFHAGMDEVFYLGEDQCPRCSGRDKAELFAGEVTRIRNHLAMTGKELWMWGDRLIDGKTTGLGIWEASFNNTHRAIDLIPKDVVICDWHYERPDPTAAYFAMKGFRVITCPWRNPDVALVQVDDMLRFRAAATDEMKDRFYGMMQTVWSGADDFLDGFYGRKKSKEADTQTAWNTFRTMYTKINALDKGK